MRYLCFLLLTMLTMSACLSVPDKPSCDEDQDGYLSAACTDSRNYPADCDDRQAEVYPGAYDIPGNDIDEDCVGDLVGLQTPDAIAVLTSERAGELERITSAAFALTLDGQHGFEPTELRVIGASDANLLYTDSATGERYLGVAFFPNFYAHTGFRGPSLSPLATNGAVARYRATWAVGDSAERATGTTAYTVHPDGRIHVDQEVTVLGALAGMNWLANYIAMNPTRINRIRPLGEDTWIVGTLSTIFYQPPANNQGYICAWHDTNRDRLTWVYRAPADQDPLVGPRASENGALGNPSHQVAMQFDWIRNDAIPSGVYRASVMVRADRASEAADPCEGGLGLTSFMHTPPLLSVAGPARLITDTEGDRDVDGYNEGGGFFAIDAGDTDAVSIAITDSATAAAPTATLRVTGLSWTRPPLVTLDGVRLEHGRDYLAELDAGGDGGWLFVNRPLPNGGTLTLREAAPFIPGI